LGTQRPRAGPKPVADAPTAPQRGSGETKADAELDSVPDAKQAYDRREGRAWQANSRSKPRAPSSTKRECQKLRAY